MKAPLPPIPATPKEAIALAKTSWWKGRDPLEVALWQMDAGLLSMDFGDFHEAVEKALGRPVWTHEFANPKALREEFFKERPAPSMAEILDLIPAEKRIVVVIDDEKKARK